MGKKWAVFGEYNIYTGTDDLLGHVDTEKDGVQGAYQALGEARLMFPHNTISHVNSTDGVMISAEEDNAIYDSQTRSAPTYGGQPMARRYPSVVAHSGFSGWWIILIVLLIVPVWIIWLAIQPLLRLP